MTGRVTFGDLVLGARFRFPGQLVSLVKVGPGRCRAESGRMLRVSARVVVVVVD